MGNLCRIPDVETGGFLPRYVTLNGFLSRLETGELERLSKNCNALLYAMERQ